MRFTRLAFALFMLALYALAFLSLMSRASRAGDVFCFIPGSGD